MLPSVAMKSGSIGRGADLESMVGAVKPTCGLREPHAAFASFTRQDQHTEASPAICAAVPRVCAAVTTTAQVPIPACLDHGLQHLRRCVAEIKPDGAGGPRRAGSLGQLPGVKSGKLTATRPRCEGQACGTGRSPL